MEQELDIDIKEFYNTWGGTTALKCVFEILNRDYPDWNLECEIGSWGVDFLQDVLAEVEDDWQDISKEELEERLQESIENLYEDCVEGHQFARLNNVRLNLNEGDSEVAALAEDDEEIGFPIIME